MPSATEIAPEASGMNVWLRFSMVVRMPHGRQGEAVGIRTTMLNLSQTFIPLASGAISVALGMAPVFALIAAALFSGAWFARRRIK